MLPTDEILSAGSLHNSELNLFSPEEEEAMLVNNPMAGLKRIAVGVAWNPHRAFLNHPAYSQAYWNNVKHTMSVQGWSHHMGFLVYDKPVPDVTKRVVMGMAYNPHRAMLNHHKISQKQWDNGASMSQFGWKQYGDFHAYKAPEKGLIRVAVGQAWNPHRIMLNHAFQTQKYWNNI